MMSCLPYIILYKTCDPGARPFFTPGSLFEKNLVEVHLVMLNTKNQGSWPCGFRQEVFSHFLYISLCKTCDPLGGAISGPRSII